jgi:hypothetical protein
MPTLCLAALPSRLSRLSPDPSPPPDASAACTTPAPCLPPLAQLSRGRAPPLVIHLPDQILIPIQATTTCWLYVNMCVIVKFETYLAIKLSLFS